jgi:hypothetical protein
LPASLIARPSSSDCASSGSGFRLGSELSPDISHTQVFYARIWLRAGILTPIVAGWQ